MKKILVVAPTSVEASYMKNAIARRNAVGKKFHNEYKVIETGSGKVNAAMETALELNADMYDLIAVVGFASGSAYFRQGDVIIPNTAGYWDVSVPKDVLPELTKMYDLQGSDDCTILTGDSVVGKSFVASLVSNFGAKALYDMESAAVAQVAEEYNIPVLIIKTVSDVPAVDTPVSREDFIKQSTDFSSVLNYLESLL